MADTSQTRAEQAPIPVQVAVAKEEKKEGVVAKRKVDQLACALPSVSYGSAYCILT